VIVQGFPPRNPYGEVIGMGEKGCESGIGEGSGFFLCNCNMDFFPCSFNFVARR
jgi:hypothetical protein